MGRRNISQIMFKFGLLNFFGNRERCWSLFSMINDKHKIVINLSFHFPCNIFYRHHQGSTLEFRCPLPCMMRTTFQLPSRHRVSASNPRCDSLATNTKKKCLFQIRFRLTCSFKIRKKRNNSKPLAEDVVLILES